MVLLTALLPIQIDERPAAEDRNTEGVPQIIKDELPDFEEGGEDEIVATYCICKNPEGGSFFDYLADPKTGKCEEDFVKKCTWEGGIPTIVTFTN